jgi:hypothetical protein
MRKERVVQVETLSPEAASVAAARLLAHAALQALSCPPPTSQRHGAAYELFDLAEEGQRGGTRLEEVREKLEQLLLSEPSEVPWQDVERKVEECVEAAREQLHPLTYAPSSR